MDTTTPTSTRNKNLIQKVKTWQCFKYTRPLTCQREGCNCKLIAKEIRQKVVLQCPKCKAIQNYIPKAVLTTDLALPQVVLKNAQRSMYFILGLIGSVTKPK